MGSQLLPIRIEYDNLTSTWNCCERISRLRQGTGGSSGGPDATLTLPALTRISRPPCKILMSAV